MKNVYEKLLKQYADALISLQDKGKDVAFRGGIHCRACKMIHGRCPDAVYAFVLLAKLTGNQKYLKAAELVFDYGETMAIDDGSLYNDAQAEWPCTTTFHEVAVMEALRTGKEILSQEFILKLETRAKKMAEWLYLNLDESNPAHINYASTTALALFLVGKYFNVKKYKDRAKRLADYAMQHFTKNKIMFGECTPHDAKSLKGCYGIDIGYNVEESIPSLVKYAYEVNDENMKNELEKILLANLDFMLPDGAWDNSFGNRNYKWTYYGSRTSDGCITGYLLMADRNPVFAEACYRNTMLLDKCSIGEDGLLFGGPDYHKHGEHACIHHAFEHINAIAFAVEHIDSKYLSSQNLLLPCEQGDKNKYYDECRTYRFVKGDYIATITDNDFNVKGSGHATGGTLTALYNKDIGPMVMASTTLYVLIEPTNMQQCLKRKEHRSLTPRIEIEKDKTTFYSSYFCNASLDFKNENDSYVINVNGGLADRFLNELTDEKPIIKYTLTNDGIKINVSNLNSGKFVLPLINGKCSVVKGKLEKSEDIFFLIGGFMAKEYCVTPNKNGEIELTIQK